MGDVTPFREAVRDAQARSLDDMHERAMRAEAEVDRLRGVIGAMWTARSDEEVAFLLSEEMKLWAP